MGGPSTRRRAAVVVVLLSVAVTAAQSSMRALELEMSDSTIERALRLARFPTSDAERARFHSRYIVHNIGTSANGVRLESIEIITEFRRTELIAEEHARINDLFGRSSLAEVHRALEPWKGQVSVAAHVRLRGTTIALPRITVALERLPATGTAEVRNIYSENAVVGAVVTIPFDARSVGQAVRTIAVTTEFGILGQTRVDFRTLD